MIAVIADDFTGAAEIAGLGLRYGLKVEIESHIYTESDADLLIIATDTRSLNEDEAYNEVFKITKQLKDAGCDWIYKKTDSVFRGHIYKELRAMLEVNGFTKALLVPANPSLGRRIEHGIYYIDNQYLHETNFSEDPDFPLITSNVTKLVRSENPDEVSLLTPDEDIVDSGINIGEAVSEEDLKRWAYKVEDEILPAGGSGFFAALLEKNGYVINKDSKSEEDKFGKNLLFVCGSAFSKGKAAFLDFNECSRKTLPMPDDVFNGTASAKKSYDEWKTDIIEAINKCGSAVIEIDQPVVRDKRFSKRLRETMALLVNELLNKVTINELLIDGGATVYSIAETVGLQKFFPVQELAPGVIRMRVKEKNNLHVTIKPGSYPWPDSLLKLPCEDD